MLNKYIFVCMLVLLVFGCSKEQKVIYEVQSISFKDDESYLSSQIQNECNSVSENLSSYINNEWKIETASPKEKLVFYNKGTCIGTEYILEKNVPPAIFAMLASKTESKQSNSTTIDSKTETRVATTRAIETPVNGGKIGTVLQTFDSSGYTYAEIANEQGVKTWLAMPKTKVSKGDKVGYTEPEPIINFQSKTLKMTFDKIYFVVDMRIVK